MQAKFRGLVTRASQGIGRATAVRLARDFDAVVLTARQQDEPKKTAAAVESAGAGRSPFSVSAILPQRLLMMRTPSVYLVLGQGPAGCPISRRPPGFCACRRQPLPPHLPGRL